ncbi:rhotekin-like [Embiotoca jacksoni]|uniref:rhotekin-like n=1 Tax=Embiotoca jacksoni TaxID=100190 RepID=UPI0037044BE2
MAVAAIVKKEPRWSNMFQLHYGKDEEVLRQVEREVRMREGASRLLAACSQREQALEASKSLLTCNARILALLSQLQRMRRAQILQSVGRRPSPSPVPCTGKLALSDLRIPLMWKDSEYFKNKGELHRCAVFCLFQCGTEIRDTDLMMVDRTLTDICFEDTIIFSDAVSPGFELRVELYSSCVVDDFYPGSLGPRRGIRLGGSLGRSSGKKIRAAFESAALCGSSSGVNASPGSMSTAFAPDLGPKYNLLAHATLRAEHVQEGFKAHDFSVAGTGESPLFIRFLFFCFCFPEDSPFWLPLYGNMCCRLVAQPQCMIQPVISGQLKVKLEEDFSYWENVIGVLRGQTLLCYGSQDDLESEEKSLLAIPITKESLVSVSERNPVQCQNIHIVTQRHGEDVTYTLTTHAPEDRQRWSEALWQHVYNMGQWRQCCDRLMKIETPSPRKSITVKQGSLYHEIVTPSSPSKGPVVPDVSLEIRALLYSYHKKSY